MYRILICYLFFMSFQNLKAQNLDWFYDVKGDITHKEILIDEKDNVYILGNFRDTVSIDSTHIIIANPYIKSNFLLKYNSNGDLLIAKKLDFNNGSIEKASFDNDNNIVLVTYIIGWEFDGIKLNKIDTNGNTIYSFIKVASYGFIPSDFYIKDLIIDHQNNIIFTSTYSYDFESNGVIYNSLGARDILIEKYNNDGNHIWTKTLNSSSNKNIINIQIDSSNNLFFNGNFQNSLDFDPGVDTFTLNSNGNDDIFILKLDEDGNFIWVEQITVVGNNFGNYLVLKENGNYLLSINSDDTISFSNYDYIPNNNFDGIIVELNSNFELEWIHSLSSSSFDLIYEIKIDNSNNIHIIGNYSDSLQIDSQNYYTYGNIDNIYQKLDSNGNLLFTLLYGGNNLTTQDYNEFYSTFSVDNQQNPIFTGLSIDTLKLNSSSINKEFAQDNTNKAFIFKLDDKDYTPILENEIRFLKLYPNPSSSFLNFNTNNLSKESYISIYNTQGSLIAKRKISKAYINIEFLISGTYYYTIKSDRTIFQGKFIKE